jgi:hypothetical protein
MEKYLRLKKTIYCYFSEDFYRKKSEVEDMATGNRHFKRPYKAVYRKTQSHVQGLESLLIMGYALSVGAVMAGSIRDDNKHFMRHLFYFVGFVFGLDFLCDFIKVYVIHSNLIKDLKKIRSGYRD